MYLVSRPVLLPLQDSGPLKQENLKFLLESLGCFDFKYSHRSKDVKADDLHSCDAMGHVESSVPFTFSNRESNAVE